MRSTLAELGRRKSSIKEHGDPEGLGDELGADGGENGENGDHGEHGEDGVQGKGSSLPGLHKIFFVLYPNSKP